MALSPADQVPPPFKEISEKTSIKLDIRQKVTTDAHGGHVFSLVVTPLDRNVGDSRNITSGREESPNRLRETSSVSNTCVNEPPGAVPIMRAVPIAETVWAGSRPALT